MTKFINLGFVAARFTVEALHLTIVDYSRFLMLIPKVKSAQIKNSELLWIS
jgi:hypothetical protein